MDIFYDKLMGSSIWIGIDTNVVTVNLIPTYILGYRDPALPPDPLDDIIVMRTHHIKMPDFLPFPEGESTFTYTIDNFTSLLGYALALKQYKPKLNRICIQFRIFSLREVLDFNACDEASKVDYIKEIMLNKHGTLIKSNTLKISWKY